MVVSLEKYKTIDKLSFKKLCHPLSCKCTCIAKNLDVVNSSPNAEHDKDKRSVQSILTKFWKQSCSLKNSNGETKIQFLSFPGDWTRERKARKVLFSSKILLLKKKKEEEEEKHVWKRFQSNLTVHVLKARTVLPIPLPVCFQPFGWNIFGGFSLFIIVFLS